MFVDSQPVRRRLVLCPAGSMSTMRAFVQSTPWWLVLLFSSHTVGWISSDEAFLFSLRNRVGRAVKMAVKQRKQREAMDSWSGDGPGFGDGDLHISDNCHTNTRSWSDPGYTYQLPAGYTRDTPQARSLLAGSYTFKCNEYEVFYRQ